MDFEADSVADLMDNSLGFAASYLVDLVADFAANSKYMEYLDYLVHSAHLVHSVHRCMTDLAVDPAADLAADSLDFAANSGMELEVGTRKCMIDYSDYCMTDSTADLTAYSAAYTVDMEAN